MVVLTRFILTNSKLLRSPPRYAQIFLLGISVPFDFPPGIFGGTVRFSEIQQFPDFLETFLERFRTISPHFKIVGF